MGWMNKVRCCFLFLLLIPNLIFALDQDDHAKAVKKNASEWQQHSELIERFNKLALDEKQQNFGFLQEAIACCQRAIARCDRILEKIAQLPKPARRGGYWANAKDSAHQDKNIFQTEIRNLQALIDNTHREIAFSKANALYQESEKKANLASMKSQNCPRLLNNVEEVVFALNEAALLCEEALSLVNDALHLISPYPDEQGKDFLKQTIECFCVARDKYKKEASEWPANIAAQKADLREQLLSLRESRKLFEEKGLKRSSYEVQKQIVSILEQLLEEEEELKALKDAIAIFEAEIDTSHLTDIATLHSAEDFKGREKERRELFFKDPVNPELFLQTLLQSRPCALPLDGHIAKKENHFTLYAEQFYRFLVQSDAPASCLVVKVLTQGQVIHEERIPLPAKNTLAWERYLTQDGMIFIPETKLKSDFGLDLRLSLVWDPQCDFSLIIAQQGTSSNYQFSISLDEGNPLYTCAIVSPPPWQLDALRKPPRDFNLLPGKTTASENPSFFQERDLALAYVEPISYPLIDQLVEELKKDPLALASYVYHEIAFVDPFGHQENGIFYAPAVHRGILRTYLEKKGSPWEQCRLLVYLLRKAGYPAFYAADGICSLPKVFCEKLLLTKLPEDQQEASVLYPWVVFFDGKEWISLFPWMKEIHIEEGHNVYNLMPEEYSSADRWIQRYLKGDEIITQWIGPDGDDTVGILFVRFVEEELRRQGLSMSDVGIHRLQRKKQFSSWQDFPRPSRYTDAKLLLSLNAEDRLFAKALIEISSHENPQKKVSHLLNLADISSTPLSIQFSTVAPHQHLLHVQFETQEETSLVLNEDDRLIDIKVSYEAPLGSDTFNASQAFTFAKGTSAALCFHFGGASPQLTSQCYEQFSSETDEKKRLHALLGFIGASYFEKCGYAEDILSSLHKIIPTTAMAFGLAKLSPDLSTGKDDLVLPQVDMFWFHVPHSSDEIACHQFKALALVNQSSNEHQILRDIFKDNKAISTVKLLQLAHEQQQGFLTLTSSSLNAIETDLNLTQLKTDSSGQWDAVVNLLGTDSLMNGWAYAYLTPSLISSSEGSYKERGALIFHPSTQYALISSNNLLFHGGLGSPLPSHFLTSETIKQWQLIPSFSSYTLQTHPPLPEPEQKWTSDVRQLFKALVHTVADPVDVVTGAFYIDENDLILPGPFPLEIRRNYNSQNPLVGDLGVGWKLSLNPYLIQQDDKLYAAETDGTVIAYRYNPTTSRWEVFLEDNPDLFNFNQKGIGSIANPFHAYIENDVLHGADGSKRYFEEGLLKKWVNNKGNTLTFFYLENKLSRIESSNGDYCGLHYNQGKISEIYAKDGRRIAFSYDSCGDLIKVILPNTAVISYEYDHSHRIIRETKPHGKVLENIYKEGKVQEQRSPMGLGQAMITTAAFDYQEGVTTVTDAGGRKTTYKIFQKQIYKIIDPLGYETLQAWFIDETSWFDPITEKIIHWNQPGGAVRSLKSSTDKRKLTTYYLYDTRGNPIEIGLQGEDLTGSGESLIAKKFSYNENNLCMQEEACGQKTLTTYDTAFPYLPKRIETYSDSTLLSYLDLEYNSDGLIEKENTSGSITLWKYNSHGFPHQKIQVTGTDDPDVVTTFSHNNQGQCIEIKFADAVQENVFDIMGNLIESKTFSPSGDLLSALYISYDLNNQPICKQTANPHNTLYLDYHASGALKASRQHLNSSIAYCLYEYDSRGYLIEEVDPLGYTTYRDYNALGRVERETKEGLSTLFTYEPGGLIATQTSPSGATTKRLYTTNGLVKEETYPDGTKSTIIYDALSRPIQETNNDITWEITYEDPHRRVTRTNRATKTSEIREFDTKGNLIRFTDAAGYISEQTYDGLNRVKTETSPTGQLTTWNYQDDTAICTLPSGEKKAQRYEGGRVAENKAFDTQGVLIESTSYHYDPENDIQQIIQGEEVTTTWLDALGLPIKVQKGSTITTYTYDLCSNCIAITDGDGRITRQAFDGLGRLTQKELPDGGLLGYVYDLDSNLAEYHLPNGTSWKASYDCMRRKTTEELQAGSQSSLHWQYTYENGYLKEAKDPQERIHTYLYDQSGRLVQETVDNWQRNFTYDARGLLCSAEQIGVQNSWWSSHQEHSKVERSYDADGRLILENIYLNSSPIQQTEQTWEASGRSLRIGNHTRHFVYQNNQLSRVFTQEIDLSYAYNLGNALQSKSTPLTSTSISYNSSGLPKTLNTALPEALTKKHSIGTPLENFAPTHPLSNKSNSLTQPADIYKQPAPSITNLTLEPSGRVFVQLHPLGQFRKKD